ncbi:type IV pilin protein [Pseudomonadota bacterium]
MNRVSGSGPRCRTAAVRGAAGYTLVEIVTVLVIAAILYSVALPGYQHTVLKSGRAAARGILLDVMTRQEQYFINNKYYAVTLADLGLPEPYYINSQAEAVAEARATYQVNLEIQDEAYSGVAAVPHNRQSRDEACMTFSISRTGIRAVSGVFSREPAHCWR